MSTRRDESFCPSVLLPQRESISSMKMMAGFFSLAISKSDFTRRSDSPIHFDIRSEELTEKKVASASVAHAFARNDLPVPGGPYSSIPDQDLRASSKNWGNLVGRMTASWRAALASSRPATSVHFTFGFSVTMAPDKESLSLLS